MIKSLIIQTNTIHTFTSCTCPGFIGTETVPRGTGQVGAIHPSIISPTHTDKTIHTFISRLCCSHRYSWLWYKHHSGVIVLCVDSDLRRSIRFQLSITMVCVNLFTFIYCSIFAYFLPHIISQGKYKHVQIARSSYSLKDITINARVHTHTHSVCIFLCLFVFVNPNRVGAPHFRQGVSAGSAEGTQSWLSVFSWINNPGLCGINDNNRSRSLPSFNSCIKHFIVRTGSHG